MGKVVLKVLDTDENKNYVPTDAVDRCAISGLSAVKFDINETATAIIENETDLTKNPDAGYLTAASHISISAPDEGGRQATLRGVVYKGSNTTAVGELVHIQIVDPGSGYSSAPTVSVKDTTGTTHTFTATLGTGVPSEGKFQEFLLAEEGKLINNNGVLVNNTSDLSLNNAPAGTENTFGTHFKDIADNVKQLNPLNIYNRNVKLGDMAGFGKSALTLWSSRESFKKAEKEEAQLIEYNKTMKEQLKLKDEADYRNALKDHEIAIGKINHAEAAKLRGPMTSFQQRWGTDMRSFSNVASTPATADPIWTSLFNLVSRSNWAGSLRKFSYSEGKLRNILRRRRFRGTPSQAGFPNYPPDVVYPDEPTYKQTPFETKEAGYLSQTKMVAKFFLWKTICFAAFATLVHLYELMSSAGNYSTFQNSGGNIPYCARAWAPNPRDGMFVSWFKTEMRNHDIIMFLQQLRSYITASIPANARGLSKKLTRTLGVGYSSIEQKKLDIIISQAKCGASVESLKSLDTTLAAFLEYADSTPNNLGISSASKVKGFALGQVQYAQGLIRVAVDKAALAYDQIKKGMTITGGGVLNAKDVRYATIDLNKDAKRFAEVNKVIEKRLFQFFGDKTYNETSTSVSLKTGGKAGGISPISMGYELWGAHLGYGDKARANPVQFDLVFDATGTPSVPNDTSNDESLTSNMVIRFPLPVITSVDVYNGDFEANDTKLTFQQVQARAKNTNIRDGKINLAQVGAELDYIQDQIDVLASELNQLIAKIEDAFTQVYSESATSRGRSTARSTAVTDVLNNIITYSISKAIAGGNGQGAAHIKIVDQMSKFAIIDASLGRCEKGKLLNWDKEHFNTFFTDIDSYNSTRAESKATEDICNKASCGVVQVYSSMPSVGEETVIADDGLSLEENGSGPMCGNITYKYNLHPTVDLSLQKELSEFATNLTNSSRMTTDLRIKTDDAVNSAFNTDQGTWGDISMPPVFGNWSPIYSVNEPKEGKFGALVKAPFKILFGIAQLYENEFDWTIIKHLSAKVLGTDYLTDRYYKSDAKVGGSALRTAPNKHAKFKVDEYWNHKTAVAYEQKHKEKLKSYYEQVAINKTNPHNAKTAAADNHDWVDTFSTLKTNNYVTPVLSTEQRFSGLCYPVIKEYGITTKGFRADLSQWDLGNYCPTLNDKQTEEEIYVGRAPGNSLGATVGWKNADHLPVGKLEKNASGAFTEAGSLANKEVFIPNTDYFSAGYKAANTALTNISQWCPKFTVEDVQIAFITKTDRGQNNSLRKPAGGESHDYVESADLTEVDNATIQAKCVDITNYAIEAAAAYAIDYWPDPNGGGQIKQPWDSWELKSNHRIPHYQDNSYTQLGSSYISGKEADDAVSAESNLRSNINLYHSWVNKLHFTGAHLTKEGARVFTSPPTEASGYANTNSGDAITQAWTNLRTEAGATDWDVALVATDGQGLPLANSGIKAAFPTLVQATWNGANWVVGDNVLSIEPSYAGVTNHSLTAVYNSDNFTLSQAQGNWTQAITVDKCDLPDGTDYPNASVTSGPTAVAFSGEATGIAATTNDAITAARNAINNYSSSGYTEYANVGMNAGPSDTFGFFKTGTIAVTDFGSSSSTTSGLIGYDTAAGAATTDAEANWTSVYNTHKAYSCDTASATSLTEIGENGVAGSFVTGFKANSSVDIATAISTLTGNVITYNDAQMDYYYAYATEVNNSVPPQRKNTLSFANGNILGSTYKLFQTGAFVVENSSAFSGLFLWDHDQGYTTSPYMGGRASNQLWLAALQLGVVDNTSIVCKSDMSDFNCGERGSGERPIDLERDCSISGLDSCEISIIDDLDSATNWNSVMDRYRQNMYSVLRDRLASGQHDLSMFDPSLGGVSCNSGVGVTSNYSISDISADIVRVFPNSGLLSSGTSIEDANMNVTSKTDLAAATGLFSGGGYYGRNYKHTINLKEWASSGDIDIYIQEDISVVMNSGASGDCPQGEGNQTIGVGKLQRSLDWYKYATAIYKPWSSDLTSPANTGESSFTVHTPVVDHTKFVSGDFTCNNYPLKKATVPLVSPHVLEGTSQCKNWNTDIWKAEVTGAIDTAKTICIAPIGRDEYTASITVSGSIQVVTGKCDWSSNKVPVYENVKDEDGNITSQLSGYEEVKENYLLKYSEGYSGLHAYYPEGANASQANGGPTKEPGAHAGSIPAENINQHSSTRVNQAAI